MDVGLKFVLPLGFKEDEFIRVSFIKILNNTLNHNCLSPGGETDAKTYAELVDFLIDHIDVTLSLCDICPATEVDEFSNSLINIFDSKGKCLMLVKAAVTREIEKAETPLESLRRNCVATKILSIYAHLKGNSYLQVSLGPFLREIIANPDKYVFEANPDKIPPGQTIESNFRKFDSSTKKLVSALQSTYQDVPAVLREVCYTIASSAGAKFLNSKNSSVTAVSSFFILRFICPALVSPESEGLLKTAPNKEVRRTLLLLAKMIQNMANGSSSFVKLPTDKLHSANYTPDSDAVIQFLRNISTLAEENTDDNISVDSGTGSQVEQSNVEFIHKFLYHHWEDINHKMVMDQRLKGKDMRLVTFRLGNEYLQIKYQEPFNYVKSSPGFCNDIFHLKEIANIYKSNTNGHPDEFTIELSKPEGYKIILHCSKGYEIVRAILNAKTRLPKESINGTTSLSSVETSFAPLVNIAFSGLCSSSAEIQQESYNLMSSIQKRFDLNLGVVLRGGKGLRLPANVFGRVKKFSTAIALSKPEFTLDMLQNIFTAFKSTSVDRRQGILVYAIPWIKNLSKYVLADNSKESVAATYDIIRKLLDISIAGDRDYMFVLQSIWPVILEDEKLVPMVIDEIISLLMDNGIYSGPQMDDIISILTSMPSPTVCGLIVNRVTSMILDENDYIGIGLAKHPKFKEFVILISVLSAITFENPVVVERYFTELGLVIILFLHTGSYPFRKSLYNLMVNVLHSFLYSGWADEVALLSTNPSASSASLASTCEIYGNLSSVVQALIYYEDKEEEQDMRELPESSSSEFVF
ncbi:hypothetical protein DS838_003573 [Geotrichum bryndzae]|nr:hypothetical protein DS838_003573 [Geotrichum bryndzae]